MIPEDFIYKQVYKGCLAAGVKPGASAQTAARAFELYRKGKMLKGGGKQNDC